MELTGAEMAVFLPRVLAGIRRMDESGDPAFRDWRKRIVLEDLNMQDNWKCVIGQACGRFRDGIRILGLEGFTPARDYGFMTCSASRMQYCSLTCEPFWPQIEALPPRDGVRWTALELLTAAWKAQLAA